MSRKTLVMCDRSGREVGPKVTDGSDLVVSAPWLELEGLSGDLSFEDLSSEDRRIVAGLVSRLFKARVVRSCARDGSPLDGSDAQQQLTTIDPGNDGEGNEGEGNDTGGEGNEGDATGFHNMRASEGGGAVGDDWTHAPAHLRQRPDYVSTRAAAEEGLPGSAKNGAIAEGGSGNHFHRLNERWWGPFPTAARAKRSHKAWVEDMAAYAARKGKTADHDA